MAYTFVVFWGFKKSFSFFLNTPKISLPMYFRVLSFFCQNLKHLGNVLPHFYFLVLSSSCEA